MEETKAVEALSALAQAARLRIVRALIGTGPAGLTPGAIGAMLDLPASTLSFHLKALMHAGLVTQQRDGRSLIYRADLARMNALIGYLTDHCCHTGGSDVGSDAGSDAGCALPVRKTRCGPAACATSSVPQALPKAIAKSNTRTQ